MINLKGILAVFLTFMFIGCATVKGDWEKSQRINKVWAYQQFLREHPHSEFTAEAKRRIHNLDWQIAKHLDTNKSYRKFMDKHPETEFILEAIVRIEELHWQKAQRLNTIKTYQNFLQIYPQSEFRREAKVRIAQLERIEQLAWKETQGKDTLPAYRQFVIKYPNSKFIEAAKKRIHDFEKDVWQKARRQDTIDAYGSFLEKNPDSPFAEKAFEKVASDLSVLERFVVRCPLHIMSKNFQKKVEDRFIKLVLLSGVEGRFNIYDFVKVARSDIPERERGKVTMIETPDSTVIQFHLEPGDRAPASLSGIEIPMGHGSVWRFKGRVKNIMGFTFVGNESDPLRFILIAGKGLVYLYGSGKVYLRSGTIVSLPR